MEDEFYSIEDPNKWHSLFQKLHHVSKSQAGSQNEARKPYNLPRNRYRDVLPIDSSRVILQDEDNDYINANLVQVVEVNRKYILTQGPLPNTCAHFWQMVWEQHSTGIVMLNKCVERGMNKCHPYWPSGVDEPVVEYGDYKIELLSTEDLYSYRLSTLKLENTPIEESRVILHFHYTSWPDFGVPKTADDFLDFLESVRKSGVLSNEDGPCVVHCSAGIGRTGTFCLVDVCLKKIDDTGDINSVNLQETLLRMREQRLGLIQTADQLRFSYIAILQSALPVDDESDSEAVEDDEEAVPLTNGPSSNTGTSGPPPIPPRPPDLLEDASPSPSPPPPPTSLPPGPPESSTNSMNIYDNPAFDKRIESPEDDNVSEILVKYGNRYTSESDDEQERDKITQSYDDDAEAPPIPPRVESQRESQTPPDSYSATADHFLGEGRGGDVPPLPPAKPSREPSDHLIDEQLLIDELSQLEQLVSDTPRNSVVTQRNTADTTEDDRIKLADDLRKRQKEERETKLKEKVENMKDRMQRNEIQEWSLPWLVVGVVAVVGYCVYYYLH